MTEYEDSSVMTSDTKEYVLRVARAWAFKCGEDHDYLPKTLAEMNEFQPHAWVLRALEEVADVFEDDSDD